MQEQEKENHQQLLERKNNYLILDIYGYCCKEIKKNKTNCTGMTSSYNGKFQ